MDLPAWIVRHPWRPAEPAPDPEVAALPDYPVGPFRLRAYLGDANHVGARYFRLDLAGDELSSPVLAGLRNRGSHPAMNWIEVSWYEPQPQGVDLRGRGFEEPLFRALASCIPPGGHLMVEYESPAQRETERALSLGVPPVATPLGYLLYQSGVGDWIRDWYIPEGWSEGPRKLQGFRALDGEHRRRRHRDMARQLREFLARVSTDGSFALERQRARELLSLLATEQGEGRDQA